MIQNTQSNLHKASDARADDFHKVPLFGEMDSFSFSNRIRAKQADTLQCICFNEEIANTVIEKMSSFQVRWELLQQSPAHIDVNISAANRSATYYLTTELTIFIHLFKENLLLSPSTGGLLGIKVFTKKKYRLLSGLEEQSPPLWHGFGVSLYLSLKEYMKAEKQSGLFLIL